VAALRSQCSAEYQTIVERVLEPLITDQWVIGGAAELGLSVSAGEVAREVRNEEKGASRAAIVRELAGTGRTLADWVLEVRAFLLGEKIRALFARRTSRVTQAQVAEYYRVNRRLFELPERRELAIVHAGSEAQALRARRELAGGESFASVQGTLGEPPVFSRGGVIAGYEPGLYHQGPLNDAILAARPNVLSGPVHIFLGYYVFEVKRIIPAVVKPLAQVQAAIRGELPKMSYKRAFAAFVKAWRLKWVARTDCLPGYVVINCSEFGPPEMEDPYTLN
jgi:hypothetical protein